MARPITRKSEKAQRLLLASPAITGAELARKTGLNITSIYRAKWWQERPAAQVKQGEKNEQ